jgi:hypothetical protein
VKNFVPKSLNLVLYLLTIKGQSLYYNWYAECLSFDCSLNIYLATASLNYTQVCKEFLQQNANSFLERSAIVNKRLRRTQFMRKQELEVL